MVLFNLQLWCSFCRGSGAIFCYFLEQFPAQFPADLVHLQPTYPQPVVLPSLGKILVQYLAHATTLETRAAATTTVPTIVCPNTTVQRHKGATTTTPLPTTTPKLARMVSAAGEMPTTSLGLRTVHKQMLPSSGITCPVCDGHFTSRKDLLGHVRTAPGEGHELLRRQGLASPHHPALVAQGVLCCLKACGAYFNGGLHNTFRALAAHVATSKCRPCTQARHNRTREVEGPFLPTTMGGIHATLSDLAMGAAAKGNPSQTLPHASALHYCLLNPDFTLGHLRTSGAQAAASLPSPSRTLITPTATSLFRQATTTRGDGLRTAA